MPHLLLELLESRDLLNAYTFTDLGTLTGIRSRAQAINASGEVVGWYSSSQSFPFLFDGAESQDITPEGATNGAANAINDWGFVAGYARINGQTHATYWDYQGPVDLGTLGGNSSEAYGINNFGEVVGASGGHISVWLPYREPQDLGPGQATGVNDVGQIIGRIGDYGGFRYTQGVFERLAGPDGEYGEVQAINQAGDVAGFYGFIVDDVEFPHAVIWVGTKLVPLGPLGMVSSEALGLNNSGQVVGWLNSEATLWQGGTTTDLNTVTDAPGWKLFQAVGVNDAGQITGTGTAPDGQMHAYLLTPNDGSAPASRPARAAHAHPDVAPVAMALAGHHESTGSFESIRLVGNPVSGSSVPPWKLETAADRTPPLEASQIPKPVTSARDVLDSLFAIQGEMDTPETVPVLVG